jgi:hypothetical protein
MSESLRKNRSQISTSVLKSLWIYVYTTRKRAQILGGQNLSGSQLPHMKKSIKYVHIKNVQLTVFS